MLKNIKCSIAAGERQSNKSVNQFVQCIFEEDRRVKQLRAQEILSTAENPKIKAENETIDISTELKQYKREQFLELKSRQQLRENTQELRQLEIQLRAAYVSKTIAEQKAQIDRSKEHQRAMKRQEEENAEKERIRCKELLREHEEKERRKKEQLREVLQTQMAEAQQRKMEEFSEILKDKEEMTKVVKQIEAEQAQELKDLMVRREQAKQDMHNFLELQETLKRQQHSQKIDELEQFLLIVRRRDEKKKKQQDQKRRAQERKMALSEQIGRQLSEIENEKRKRERVLLDLLVEERKTKDDFRFRQKSERALLERSRAAAELESYTNNIRHEKEQHKKAEEEQIRKEIKKVMDEGDKADRIKEEQNKLKEKAHRQALLEMIDVRRVEHAKKTAEVLQEYEMLLNEQRKKDQLIEDERIRLLQAHPPDVLRYLPVGIIRESDREFLPLAREAASK